MKLVAYLRVSTEAQAEGLGLDVQKAVIIDWARTHGHKLATEFTDAGVSGSNGLDTRTGLAGAFNTLRSGDASGIVVYRLDRLARDLILQEQLLAEVRPSTTSSNGLAPTTRELISRPNRPERDRRQ